MDELLLDSKLVPPRLRQDLVARPALIDRLTRDLLKGRGFTRKLTLVSAPAGYGKTTLVADWFRSLEFKTTWLSLDEHDDDPIHFLNYLSAALSRIDPGIGNSMVEVLAGRQELPAEIISPVLVKAIEEHSNPFLLSLDDYQYIVHPQIHQIINFTIDHQPENLHMVVITREDPLIPLSRLRARGQVLEIRQSELSFSKKEIFDFIDKTTGFELTDNDLDALAGRTEGWPVGLQMTALSIQGSQDVSGFVRSFAGSNRFILDYLFDEVLDGLSSELEEFLLKTSILDRLCDTVCNAVTGRTDSYEILQKIENANLFLFPLDETRTWYRYHLLFADLLRHRLRMRGDIVEVDLHLRASIWYEENGFIKAAIQQAIEAKDWERAIDLILRNAEGMLGRGEVVTLLKFYGKLPENEIRARPNLCLRYSWPLLLSGELVRAESYLEQAQAISKGDTSLSGEISVARAFIARSRGDDRRTIEMSNQALTLLPKMNASLQAVINVNLGIAHWHTGELSLAEDAFQNASATLVGSQNRYAQLTSLIFQNRIKAAKGQLIVAHNGYLPLVVIEEPIPILSLAYLDLGALYYEWNQVEKSIEWIGKCIAHSERTRNAEFQVAGYTQIARLSLELGDLGAAFSAMQKADKLLEQHTILPLNQARNAAFHVQLALAQKEIESASHWTEKAGEKADAHNFYPFLGLAPARLYLAQRQYQAAIAYLDECLKHTLEAGWGFGEVSVRVMRSLAEGNPDIALKILLPALKLGQRQSFIRSFVEGGEDMLPLLNKAVLQGIDPDYIHQIIMAIDEHHPIARGREKRLVEALSEREIEVLLLLAAGLSNQGIADQLTISLGTVKTHLHHIYGKLGVNNRTAATSIGRETGYIK